ncbi:hypothetical protein FGO68_gene15208 [Halteria grandinella]|uniref:Uncharacterized protein n=1 Tax=Halteria grandinella TaxID=5974 RepID=A0A8J8NI60_HALGN|nr:hypothetical protein FGO68_gene15208 [Halteria grandinella]
MFTEKPHQSILFLGPQSCGKSSVAGQVVYKLGGVWNNKLEMIRQELMEINQPDYLYARIMDQRRDEKKACMTKYFSLYSCETNVKSYSLINVPGKLQYLKEILIGIALADVVVFVLSGNRESNLLYQSIYKLLLKLCFSKEIENLICVVHKMDEIQYSEQIFNQNVDDFKQLLHDIGYNKQIPFIPTSIRMNQNIKEHHQTTNWYNGLTLIEALDLQDISKQEINGHLRMLVYGGHRIPGIGTIAVGKVCYGVLQQNSIIQIAPDSINAEVGSIETHHYMCEQARQNQLIGVRLKNIQHKEIRNGQIITGDPSQSCLAFIAEIKVCQDFKHKIKKGHTYPLFLNTILMVCKIGAISDSNESPIELVANQSGIVKFVSLKYIYVETYTDYPKLGCFAIISSQNVIAIGKILEVIKKYDQKD